MLIEALVVPGMRHGLAGFLGVIFRFGFRSLEIFGVIESHIFHGINGVVTTTSHP